jgi:hypothetical protein
MHDPFEQSLRDMLKASPSTATTMPAWVAY